MPFASIGIKSFYVDDEGVKHESEKVTQYLDPNSVDEVGAGAVAVSCTDLSGVRVDNPGRGFYIRTMEYPDGRRVSEKVMFR